MLPFWQVGRIIDTKKIRNYCNIFGVDAVIHSKNGGKVFGVDTSINPINITIIN